MLESSGHHKNHTISVLSAQFNTKQYRLVSSDLGEDIYFISEIKLNAYSSEKLWEILRNNHSLMDINGKRLHESARNELKKRGQFDASNPWMAPH